MTINKTSQLLFICEHSSTFTNPNYRKQNDRKQTQFQSSRKSILDQDSLKDNCTQLSRLPSLNSPPNLTYDPIASTPSRKANHRIEWEHINDDLTLIVELPIQEFQGSAIQLCLWSISSNKKNLDDIKSPQKTIIKKAKNQHNSEYMDLEIQDHHLVAETYINLSNMETSVSDDKGTKFLIIKSHQPKSIWYHGVEVGKIDYEINVRIPNYLQQSSFGVQTEKGIVSSISVVGNVENISVTEIKMISSNQKFKFIFIFKDINKYLALQI